MSNAPKEPSPSLVSTKRGVAKRRKTDKVAVATASADAWLPAQRTEFVIRVLGGTRRAAKVLEVSPSQPSRWAKGEAVPDPEHARVLVDVDHVLALALQVWEAEVARDWLTTANAFLDDGRPIDVIMAEGSSRVAEAIRAEAAGAYA